MQGMALCRLTSPETEKLQKEAREPRDLHRESSGPAGPRAVVDGP